MKLLDKPTAPETTDSSSSFSRRDFLIRSGQVAALSVVQPNLSEFLRARSEGTLVDARDAALWQASRTDLRALNGGLRWRMLGPFRGGRVAAACGVPGRLNEFYFGSVNGGVWKSIQDDVAGVFVILSRDRCCDDRRNLPEFPAASRKPQA